MPRDAPTNMVQFGLQLALLATMGAGCDFFHELESEPTPPAADSDGGTEGTGDPEADGPCDLAEDDRCLDQDTVRSCSVEDGLVTELDCPALCGGYTNFSCVAAGNGQHTCWCVEPGPTKVLSCTELESCLSSCASATDLSCADQCFGRTDALTIRILGALVHCAEESCADTCRDAPESCSACVEQARVAGEGGCSLPRAICDDDRNPDEPWP